ncbi:MAG: hypothetical protein BroJett011_04190 [Chloroflexota bacterium]|nr:MAG: hypothetical protein BroJett011_04190 [Chloroflexota bacterium]
MTTSSPLKPLKSRSETASVPASPPARKPGPNLTFSDGLNFGCGFFVAGFLFSILIIPVSVFMISLLIGLLGGMTGLGR